MKNPSSVLILVVIIVVLYFWFHKPTPLYSNDKQDSTIKVSDVQIALYKKNETRHDSIIISYKGVITEKENQVSDLQTKLSKSYVLTGIVAAISIFLIVLL